MVSLFPDAGVRQITATDYDERMLEHLHGRFADQPLFDVLSLKIDSPESVERFSRRSFDRISCLNVLEHIEADLLALRHMHQLLAPHGKLVLLVPALPFLYGSLDALVGHYRRYTKKSIKNVLTATGFTVEYVSYMNFWGMFSWFTAGKIFQHQSFSARACRRLDTFVPFLEKMELLIRPPFGQTLIAVASKKAFS